MSRRIEEGSGKSLKQMSKDEFDATILQLRNEARSWIDNEIAPQQEAAWRYYNGQVDQKAPPHRSRVVMTTLRDSVESVMVSLLRIFLTQTPARFEPVGPDDYDIARQRTQTADYIFFEQNDGYRLLNDAFRDGLVAKYGVAKCFWSDADEITEHAFSGLDDAAVTALVQDPEVELIEVDADAELNTGTYAGKIRRTRTQGQVEIEAVPNEELIIDKRSSCPEEALIVGQDGLRRAQEIVNDGLATYRDVEKYGTPYAESTTAGTSNMTLVRTARADYQSDINVSNNENTGDIADPSTELLRVSELYVRIDRDGDGVPELHRCVMLSDHVISSEVWDRQPFHIGSPFIRPHTALGYGLGDMVMDLQEISTATTRGMLDSLYQAVNPQKMVVQGQANLEDVLANKFSGTIRVRNPDAVRHLDVPFVGRDVLPIHEWLDQRKEERTGISKAALGLDADALQSSTAIGVNATITAAQAKVESMARAFGESLVAGIYDHIAYLVTQHQDQELDIRINGQPTQVDPRSWTTRQDITTTVGLGRGTQQERLQMLGDIATKQEQLMAQFGPDNAIAGPTQYAITLQDMTSTAGEKNPNRYFNPPQVVDAELKREMAEKEQNPQPSPEEQKLQMEMQAQQQKMQMDQQKQQADAMLDKQKAEADIQLQREKMQAEIQLAQWKAEQEMRLRLIELGAEAELESMELEMKTSRDAGSGNLPSPVN